jgi:carbonic anhydrase
VALIAASCGSGEVEDAGTEHVSVDHAEEMAEEALATAEQAMRAVEALERELEEAPDELAHTDEEDGHDEDDHDDEDEDGTESDHASDEMDEEEADAHEPGHWSYSGETGPDHWAEISAEFALCEAGVEQSPIDIVDSDAFEVGLDDLVLSWQPSSLTVLNNGHTIQANVAAGNTTTFDGVDYDLVQFHFHKPSEHTINSEPFPMELHFVHATAEGDLAVIGVLLAEGEANPAFDILWAAQDETDAETEATAEVADFDLTSLLPDDLSRYRYSGSLTTPPCSEGVNWNVLANPVTMSTAQIEAFVHDGNARPVLPLGQRSVLVDRNVN